MIHESWRMRAAKRCCELMHEIQNKGAPHKWIWDDLFNRLVEFWRQEDFKKLKQINKRNMASETGESLHTGRSTTYMATRKRMIRSYVTFSRTTLELGPPSHSEVFVRTHTRKDDRLWVDKRSEDVNS
ncbi:hypothetical protein PIB30_003574 [Stylosanthes scabra]|uniref:Uncharacterized protein n=1 Tax=Stylosanthes scabra TaxID=79078 RepID=A0ABU6X345_9FABA|nr:hypothetical protein [Stylosanthes scabra]